jgi:hypothetical protein
MRDHHGTCLTAYFLTHQWVPDFEVRRSSSSTQGCPAGVGSWKNESDLCFRLSSPGATLELSGLGVVSDIKHLVSFSFVM